MNRNATLSTMMSDIDKSTLYHRDIFTLGRQFQSQFKPYLLSNPSYPHKAHLGIRSFCEQNLIIRSNLDINLLLKHTLINMDSLKRLHTPCLMRFENEFYLSKYILSCVLDAVR